MKKALIFIMLCSILAVNSAFGAIITLNSALTSDAINFLEQKFAKSLEQSTSASPNWAAIRYNQLRGLYGDAVAETQAKTALDASLSSLDTEINQSQAIPTEAISVYAQGYAITHDNRYRETAEKIAAYLTHTLIGPEGAFYSNGHIYARENGLAINALAHLYMITGNLEYLEKAQKALLFVNTHRGEAGGGYSHEATDYATPYLADNLAMARAELSLYQATANLNYLIMSEHAANFIINHFKPTDNTIDDNAQLALFANLLFYYTGNSAYQTLATEAVNNTVNFISRGNYNPANLLIMNLQLSHEPAHITIVGGKNDPKARILYQTALGYPNFYKRIEWWDRTEKPLPNMTVTYPELNHAAAFVCINHRCSLPITNPEKMLPLMQHLIQDKAQVATSIYKPNVDATVLLLTKANWFILIIGFFGFGCLLAFTPCVLPMLPILAGIIVGQGMKVTVRRAFTLSLIYVVSMSLTYALAGLLTGYLGRYIQSDLQNSWAISGLSIVFVLLALSLFGFYELEMPKRLRHHMLKFTNRQKSGNYFGVAVMGCLSTLIASPCITPPLIGVLGYIAESGNALLGGLALFVMGLGMGLPLLLAGTLGGKFLPKAGPWLDDVKFFFGFVLLGTAIWMLSRIAPENIVLLMWVALALAATIFLAFFTNTAVTRLGKFSKAASVMAVIFGIILLTVSMLDNLAPLTFDRYFPGSPQFQIVYNVSELQNALTSAKKQSKPVLLDYYAKWCVSCRSMAVTTFRDKNVKKLLKNFVLLEADMTDVNPDTEALAKYFNIIAPPTILFFDAEGKLLAFRIYGDMDPERFSDDLRGVLTNRVQ